MEIVCVVLLDLANLLGGGLARSSGRAGIEQIQEPIKPCR